jgi:type I site-specific restriction endonuclease
MPKSYSAFEIEDLLNLGLIVDEEPFLKEVQISDVQPSVFLLEAVERGKRRKLTSEKAKSEHLIAPILSEVEEFNNRSFATFSGYKFNVDKALGLAGFCDFILTKEPKSPIIQAPVFCIVEAKNDNLDVGLAQCIAEMYASQIFNQKKLKNVPTIYGATTFGFEWKFIKMNGNQVKIDNEIYYLNELPKLLGVLNYIVNQ